MIIKRMALAALLLIGPCFARRLPAQADSIKSLDIPRLHATPHIDGILDERLWEREALRVDDFLQFTPVEKGTPTEKTVAFLGYDEKNLYLAFRCFDSDPGKLRASITNRDDIFEDDWVIIFLDTFNEKRRAFAFFINPRGIQMDGMRLEEGGNDDIDSSWDTVFHSDGRIDELGYTVEMAVPFKSLRFPDTESNTWGLTLGRSIARKGEVLIWPPMSRDRPGLLCQAGEMRIPDKLDRGKNLEVMPIFTSLKTKGEKIDAQPGLNFKWGVSSDLTLDFTVNPDFSQIEADVPQIDFNQRFALYYPEKRPFFLEGMEIFRFPEIQMVYTRRITDPMAGAKLSGKAGRFTYGLLSSLDTSPTESLWDVSNGAGVHDQNALFNIFRVKADVLKESYLGFSLTDKEINGSYNRVAGVDGQFKFRKKLFVSFQALASKTSQGEDASALSPALYANIGYYDKHLGGGLYWLSIHPDFEAGSGYVNRTDYRSAAGYAYARLYPEKPFLNQVEFRMSGGRRLAYSQSIAQDEWAEAEIRFRFTEFSQARIEYRHEMENYAGVDFRKAGISASGELQMIGWLPFGFSFRTGEDILYDPDEPFLGYSNAYGLYFTLKPSNRLRMSMSFSKETFWEKRGGDQVYDYNVLHTRTTYQISKTLSLRAILDYNHFYRQIYGSFLFSYVLKPGTVFFLGVDDDYHRDDSGLYRAQSYSVFLKFSYWHRL
jgi:uncharacterized protein DUF5916/cellulose/xylan binding protein with CBM9 domain